LRNTNIFCKPDLPYTIEADSDTFFRRWSAAETATDVFGRNVDIGGSLSFCYIDGNHSYESAKRDFANTDRFLAPGGFIFFDDSGDGSGWEVCKVVEEVLKSGSYDLIAKNPNYFFQKAAWRPAALWLVQGTGVSYSTHRLVVTEWAIIFQIEVGKRTEKPERLDRRNPHFFLPMPPIRHYP
jgi:hypothetical protein